jgi:hypothetical protein
MARIIMVGRPEVASDNELVMANDVIPKIMADTAHECQTLS